jgi:hypothetical protein
MNPPPRLSATETARQWLSQFEAADRPAASALLDEMLLLNDEQVATAIRSLLLAVARDRNGKRKRIALYAERPFAEASAFEVTLIPDADAQMRRRAVGWKGPAAVKPVRGLPRIGSEGWMAFIISQAVETSPKIYMNHPGPDRLRARTFPPSAIAIVTDFIGSGQRVRTMLDKFWAVPTIRSWRSGGFLKDFMIIAAAGTSAGLDQVRNHHLKPRVLAEYVAPTLHHAGNCTAQLALLQKYGPSEGRGAGRKGFGDNAALIAFSYRIPNNTPALIHADAPGWRALYTGSAPNDLRAVFGVSAKEQLERASFSVGASLSNDLSLSDARMIIVLSAIRGRWRPKSETALAEITGFPEPEIVEIHRRAIAAGLLDRHGRLTDDGQLALAAGTERERKRPDIPIATAPYYPQVLRAPWGLSSTRRRRRPR